MEACAEAIRDWMRNNFLKLDNNKIEFLISKSRFSTKKFLDGSPSPEVWSMTLNWFTDDRGSTLRQEGPSGKGYVPAGSSVPPVICGTSCGT